MSTTADVSKVMGYAVTGKSDVVQVSKLVAYFVLIPGEDDGSSSGAQGHVYTNITRRLRR